MGGKQPSPGEGCQTGKQAAWRGCRALSEEHRPAAVRNSTGTADLAKGQENGPADLLRCHPALIIWCNATAWVLRDSQGTDQSGETKRWVPGSLSSLLKGESSAHSPVYSSVRFMQENHTKKWKVSQKCQKCLPWIKDCLAFQAARDEDV